MSTNQAVGSMEDDGDDEAKINEEYNTWKKNTAFLYDLVVSHALEWPSLTCEWLPIKEVSQDKDYSVQQVILGTHTSQVEQNYLLNVRVILPIEEAGIDIRKYDSSKNEIGGFGGKAKVEISQKINHEGEVNKARHMPQQHTFIATHPPSPTVFIFDYSKQPTQPHSDGVCRPLLKLKGHQKDGYGLAWNSRVKGRLASGADDGLVCVWDIDSTTAGGKTSTGGELQPLHVLSGHDNQVVEDVNWNKFQDSYLASVGDDKSIRIWDLRNASSSSSSSNGLKSMHKIANAHQGEVNGVDFSPFSEYLFVTSSSDKLCKLWDMRSLKSDLHTFASHQDQVFTVAWSPFNETIFASASSDRRVMVWDLAKIGAEQSAEDAEDGPPELLFIHGGHTSKVCDISWNQSKGEEWVMMSTADDNILQIWQMGEHIYMDQDQPVDDEMVV